MGGGNAQKSAISRARNAERMAKVKKGGSASRSNTNFACVLPSLFAREDRDKNPGYFCLICLHMDIERNRVSSSKNL